MIFGCYRKTENTLYDLFTIPTPRITKENVRKCIYPTANPNIDIIPGNEDDDAICTDVENGRSRLVQLILKYILANKQRNMTENFKQQKARRLIQFYEMKQEQTGEKINVTKKVSEKLGIRPDTGRKQGHGGKAARTGSRHTGTVKGNRITEAGSP